MPESAFRAALEHKNSGPFPVWLMRQAGRALKSYRELKDGVDFLTFCKTAELAGEATLLPVRELQVDAAILFHDLLLPLEGLGVEVHYPSGSPPTVAPKVRSPKDLQNLSFRPLEAFYGYVREVVAYVRSSLPPEVPLIGFVGGPFTVAVYLAGGEESLKTWREADPVSFQSYLCRLGELLVSCARFQVEAGAELVQVFDSHLHLLEPEAVRTFYRPVLEVFLQQLPSPRIYFCRGWKQHLPSLLSLPCEVLSLDSTVSLARVRETVRDRYVLQGNLAPEVLREPPDVIRKEVWAMLEPMREDPAYIVNLGHGVLPDTPEKHLQYFVELVHGFRHRV